MQKFVVDRHVFARHRFGIRRRLLFMFVGFGEIFAGERAVDCLFAALAAAGRTNLFADSRTESSGFRGFANGAWHFFSIRR